MSSDKLKEFENPGLSAELTADIRTGFVSPLDLCESLKLRL